MGWIPDRVSHPGGCHRRRDAAAQLMPGSRKEEIRRRALWKNCRTRIKQISTAVSVISSLVSSLSSVVFELIEDKKEEEKEAETE